MSSLIIKGDTSGAITLSAPNAAGSSTYTLPAVNGSVMVSGNMPAFSAYANSGTSIPNATWTKVIYNAEGFDTASCYDSTTNYRFTPNVAGYYQISAMTRFGSITATIIGFSIHKNGSFYATGGGSAVSSGYVYPSVSALVDLNGTTDYVEIYTYQNSGGSATTDNGFNYVFTGCLMRAA